MLGPILPPILHHKSLIKQHQNRRIPHPIPPPNFLILPHINLSTHNISLIQLIIILQLLELYISCYALFADFDGWL